MLRKPSRQAQSHSVIRRMRCRFIDRKPANAGIRPRCGKDGCALRVNNWRKQIAITPALQGPRRVMDVSGRKNQLIVQVLLDCTRSLKRTRVSERWIKAKHARLGDQSRISRRGGKDVRKSNYCIWTTQQAPGAIWIRRV